MILGVLRSRWTPYSDNEEWAVLAHEKFSVEAGGSFGVWMLRVTCLNVGIFGYFFVVQMDFEIFEGKKSDEQKGEIEVSCRSSNGIVAAYEGNKDNYRPRISSTLQMEMYNRINKCKRLGRSS